MVTTTCYFYYLLLHSITMTRTVHTHTYIYIVIYMYTMCVYVPHLISFSTKRRYAQEQSTEDLLKDAEALLREAEAQHVAEEVLCRGSSVGL